MGTVFANIITLPFSGTNDITITLYVPGTPPTFVVSQTENYPATAGQLTWSFPGLLTQNYYVEVTEAGNPVPLATFTMVPNNNGFDYKPAYLMQVGITPGLVGGTNSATFDGTGGTDNWIGWSPIIDRVGADTMKPDVDYTYDILTGQWTLLQAGDQFTDNEYYFIQFEPRIVTGGGTPASTDGVLWTTRKIITGADSLLADDAGKKIIIKGASDYFEIALPDITTVPENKLFYIESARASHKGAFLKCFGSQVIDWLEGNLPGIYINPNESIEIYREQVVPGTDVWRVHNNEGNFKSVGQDVSEDMDADHVFNKVLLDGTEYDIEDLARFYNRYILRLPAGQVVPYASWSANKTKFSLANGSNKFFVADRRGLVEKVVDVAGLRSPGDFEGDNVKSHYHDVGTQNIASDATFNRRPSSRRGNTRSWNSFGQTDALQSNTTDMNRDDGTNGTIAENTVKNYAVNKYKLT